VRNSEQNQKGNPYLFKGNPVHEEALRVAKMVGCDMIVNVTLDSQYRLTGVFAGDMEKAHIKAVKKLNQYAFIQVNKKYDLVISHSGYVGVNHYQAAKAGVMCSSLKELTVHSVSWALKRLRSQGIKKPEIAVLLDGPYGIPLSQKRKIE